jgi:hypothetical protein
MPTPIWFFIYIVGAYSYLEPQVELYTIRVSSVDVGNLLNRNHTANSHHLAKNHQRADDFE